jgi:carboxypeptidase Q
VRRRELLFTALAAGAFGARAQPAPAFAADDLRRAAALRDAGLADTEAWRLVEALTTEVGARPAGSAADARAAQWALAQSRRLGLAGGRIETFPLKVWQRGPAAARLVAPVPQPLVMAALGNSVAAPAGGIEAEVAWYADLAALRADTSERARGRIVFIDQRTERWRDGRGYGAAVPARTTGAVEAAKRGALALAIRSIGTDRDRIAHTGAMSYEPGVERIPAFAVSAPDADLIARLQARAEPLRLQFTLESRSGVEATTHNVIAEVAGGELAHEVVLIGAHLDSWDLGQGAIDDGAGVAIVLAAAAQIARLGVKPRRTVRVVLFGNEENGFDGARDYGNRHGQAPHQLVAESDFGSGRVWRSALRVQPAALPLAEEIGRQLQPLGIEWSAAEANPGPDAAVLMRRFKWPALQLSQDGTKYFDVHHTENDTLDKVERESLPQNVAAWAVAAWLAAQSPLPFYGAA